jgi:hypothetical protein
VRTVRISFVQQYGKAILSALYAVAIVAVPLVSGDHHIDPSEGIIISTAIGGALLTYIVPLKQEFKSVKTWVHAVLAGLAVAQTQIAGGIDANDVLLIVAAALSVLGVAVMPAASDDARAPQGVVRVGFGADR